MLTFSLDLGTSPEAPRVRTGFLIYRTRGALTQAPSASDGTVARSPTLRVGCGAPTRLGESGYDGTVAGSPTLRVGCGAPTRLGESGYDGTVAGAPGLGQTPACLPTL